MKKLQLFAAILLLSNGLVLADTHYVSSSTGTDSGDCTNTAAPCASLRYSIGQMVGGDILEITSGAYAGAENDLDTYNGTNFIPSGSEGAYTIIHAADDGTVNISAPFSLASSSAYLQFEGLKFNSDESKSVNGHHIRLLRSAFEGGPPTFNTTGFSIGNNDGGPNGITHHILLQDVWAYGPGGRYNILIYNSENIIVRRAIIRHDAGWATDCSNPEAGITIYNSRFVQLQNVIVLDSISDNNNVNCAQGITGFYNVSNSSGGTQHENTRIVGSMALNNSVETGMAWDDGGSIPNANLEHSVIFNSGTSLTANGNDKQVNASNLTIDGGTGDGVAIYGNNNTINLSRTIIRNKAGQALRYASGVDVLCDANTGGNSGCNITDVEPGTNGLLFLPRIEDASVLKTAGTGGTQIGATILNKIGADNTFYGDVGFDTEQDALWPWPLEDRIFNDLCAVRTSSLCGSASITDYVWSALGNTLPTNLQPMPKPTGLSVQKN